MVVITHNYLKSVSTSDYKKIMELVKTTLHTEQEKALQMFDTIIDTLKQDEIYYKSGVYTKITDCALFAPRHSAKINSSSNPIRLAYYGAE